MCLNGCDLLDVYSFGTFVGSRPAVNFADLSAVDNPATDAVDVTATGLFAAVPHDDGSHVNPYVSNFQPFLGIYNAADVAVSANAAVTVAGTTAQIPAGFTGFIFPLGVMLSYRAGTITVQGIVDIWFEVGGVQVSAKYPVYVDPANLTRQPVGLPLVGSGVGDTIYWGTRKAAGNYVTNIRAQRRASADLPAATILISDRGIAMLAVSGA